MRSGTTAVPGIRARRAPRPDVPARWTGAVRRGVANRCPRCGEGRIFESWAARDFVRVAPACETCGLDLSGHRADDLPPYLVIFVVGHLLGILILESEMRLDVPLWLSLAVWPLLALVMGLALMRPAKGGVVGLQYGLGMHGFDAIRRRDLGGGPGREEPRGRDAGPDVGERDAGGIDAGAVDAGARGGGA